MQPDFDFHAKALHNLQKSKFQSVFAQSRPLDETPLQVMFDFTFKKCQTDFCPELFVGGFAGKDQLSSEELKEWGNKILTALPQLTIDVERTTETPFGQMRIKEQLVNAVVGLYAAAATKARKDPTITNRQRAIYHANAAGAFLVAETLFEMALQEAELALAYDPTYLKGYYRAVKAALQGYHCFGGNYNLLAQMFFEFGVQRCTMAAINDATYMAELQYLSPQCQASVNALVHNERLKQTMATAPPSQIPFPVGTDGRYFGKKITGEEVEFEEASYNMKPPSRANAYVVPPAANPAPTSWPPNPDITTIDCVRITEGKPCNLEPAKGTPISLFNNSRNAMFPSEILQIMTGRPYAILLLDGPPGLGLPRRCDNQFGTYMMVAISSGIAPAMFQAGGVGPALLFRTDGLPVTVNEGWALWDLLCQTMDWYGEGEPGTKRALRQFFKCWQEDPCQNPPMRF